MTTLEQCFLSRCVHPGVYMSHCIICSVLTHASGVTMIKTLMSKGNKHTLRDMAWISRTLIYASYKHQVSHVGYGSSSCTQYDRLKRSFLSSSILQLCLKACYVNLGTRKLNDGDSNSDICVYVDSKSAMSFE